MRRIVNNIVLFLLVLSILHIGIVWFPERVTAAYVTSFTVDDDLNVTITNVDSTKFQAYFAYKNRSTMNPISTGLVNTGNAHSINSVFTMALAAWEGGWGTSSYCTSRHNWFGYGALYSNPDLAWEFTNDSECVDVVTRKIKGQYLLDSNYGNYQYLIPQGSIYNPSMSQYHNGPPYIAQINITGSHYHGSTLRGWIIDWNINSQSEMNGILSIMNDFADWHLRVYGEGLNIKNNGIRDMTLVGPSQGSYQGRVYWLQNGKLYWITATPDEAGGTNTIDLMSTVPNWGWPLINMFPDGLQNFSGWPGGVARFVKSNSESNGLLIRRYGDTTAYLVQNGKKYWLPDPDAVVYAGYSMADIIDVSDPINNFYPEVANNSQKTAQSSTINVTPGQTFNISVTMKNTGTSVWAEPLQYRLGWLSGYEPFPGNSSFIRQKLNSAESIATGSSRTWNINGLTAPGSAGTYTIVLQMVRENVGWFGETANIQVIVQPNMLPIAPTLSLPTNGSSQPGTSLTFTWNGSATGATDYNLCVWSSSGTFFDQWVGNVGTRTLSGFPNDGRTFNWCIYPRNSAGIGAKSSVWNFTNGNVLSPPGTPSLIAPDNASSQSTSTITFRWNDPGGATDYNLYIWNNSMVYHDHWVGNTTSHDVYNFPLNGTEFAWKVLAKNSAGYGNYSPTRTFTSGTALTLPTAPTLSSPTNGSSQPGTSLTFSWGASSGATDYDLYIWSSAGSFHDHWIGNATSHEITGLPNDSRTFSWRVYPRNSAGMGPSSSVWTFVNGSTVTVPPAPTLSSPTSGSTQSGTSLTFSWSASSGATDYDLYIWSSAGSFHDAWIGNATSHNITGLPNDGRTFSWRVYPRNSAGIGTPSSVWTFVNGSTVLPAPTLSAPANGSTQAVTSLTFSWGASSGATDYDLYVWSSAGSFHDHWIVNATSHEITGLPNDGRTFSWRVYPRNSAGMGPSSAVWTFVNGTALGTPALTSPGSSFTVKWSISGGATKYQLQVNTNSSFTGTDLFNSDVGNITSQEVTGLSTGTTYHLHVRAGNAAGWGNWSTTRSFLAN